MIKYFQKISFYLIIIGIFLITVQCEASEDTGYIQYLYHPGFEFFMPKKWKIMSQEIIDEYKQEDTEVEFLVTGFELKSSAADSVFPYIFVSINQTGKISADDLASCHQLQTNGSKNIIESLSNDAIYDTPVYDPALQTIWLITQENIEGYGDIYSLVARRLTGNGWVEMMMQVESHQYPELAAEFQQIVNSIQLQKGLEYNSVFKPSLYDTIQNIAVIICICSILFFSWLFSYLKNKAKQDSSKEASESVHLQNSEHAIIREFKAPPGGDKRKNKIVLVFLAIVLLFPSVVLFIWDIIKAYRDHDSGIEYRVIFSLISIIFMGLLVILTYFSYKKSYKKLFEPFTIVLLENSIIIRIGAIVHGLKFDRHQIKSVKETYFGLKVSAGIGKRVIIPKDTEGYEELKAKLLEWVNPTIHGHGDSISSH